MHRPVRDGDRWTIESLCTTCGATKIGTLFDAGLEKWESEHACPKCSGKVEASSP
jgi:DNA-directed RNA polymerase subunit RPC12/RpoP